ncbi:MAG: hypothetical protein V9H69_07535 [Anaerolineae bacterium]
MNTPIPVDAAALRGTVLAEFFGLLGLAEAHPLRRTLTRLLSPAIGRFTDLLAKFDSDVAAQGLPAAIRPAAGALRGWGDGRGRRSPAAHRPAAAGLQSSRRVRRACQRGAVAPLRRAGGGQRDSRFCASSPRPIPSSF